MSETVPFTVEAGAATLHGIADLPDLPGERPAVVICHGFKGFMEWEFFPYVASLLAERASPPCASISPAPVCFPATSW